MAATNAHLNHLIGKVIDAWPHHERFVRNSLAGYGESDLQLLDELSRKIGLLAGEDIDSFIGSYRWLCGEMNKEALYFKKHGTYRYSSFADAERLVYSNRSYMQKYMEGLLVSQLIWRNHSASFLFFTTRFLPRLDGNIRYLEIGPGHGLYLSTAAETVDSARVEGWDVSEESLRQTRRALGVMGGLDEVMLLRRDVLAPAAHGSPELFDGIAISEVLEHIERPGDALTLLRRRLAPQGVIFINVPINSPAPDHIYLLRNAGEARALVEGAGLEIIEIELFAMTGLTIEEAVRQNATISCVIIAK